MDTKKFEKTANFTEFTIDINNWKWYNVNGNQTNASIGEKDRKRKDKKHEINGCGTQGRRAWKNRSSH